MPAGSVSHWETLWLQRNKTHFSPLCFSLQPSVLEVLLAADLPDFRHTDNTEAALRLTTPLMRSEMIDAGRRLWSDFLESWYKKWWRPLPPTTDSACQVRDDLPHTIYDALFPVKVIVTLNFGPAYFDEGQYQRFHHFSTSTEQPRSRGAIMGQVWIWGKLCSLDQQGNRERNICDTDKSSLSCVTRLELYVSWPGLKPEQQRPVHVGFIYLCKRIRVL